MQDRIYHLSTCDTNRKILAEVKPGKKVKLINIKENNISEEDLDLVAAQLGGYEQVFSKKAMKYRSLKLNERVLTENEMKQFILDEYTFLKRPVSIINGKAFAGYTKDSIEGLKCELHVGKK